MYIWRQPHTSLNPRELALEQVIEDIPASNTKRLLLLFSAHEN